MILLEGIQESMADNYLPQNVGRLVDKHIYSVSQLETLLFLRRYQDRNWTAHEIGNEFHTNDNAAMDILGRLAEDGFVKRFDAGRAPEFAYVPMSADMEADIEALAEAYRNTRLRVVDRIYRKPEPDNSLRSIADSFLWRRDQE
ncbi:MAG TPA: hypothetical protein V6D22_18315 [Candidatus Obscuribacterales bacterium]